ncbi:urate hydroxylase PuuD [Microbulbifer bruguierae]|uniref:Urate hydroxylase PuuD n=1 Tax=Microbulbifer bruguierae TaxID=3029061 RepID=A0ABY8NBJ9_9GAMM|nr:urate hydroxylase PuuD [Microbulbifer bruguierae]WGL15167.1 urate hydroxylase PuuD [Microbulbifer bruguierae]
MEAYLSDWLQLILRLLHVITGIAWIGASFYFIWLDNHLQTPPQWKKDRGIAGDLWAIHGGGIYEVAKYRRSPGQLPETLHWFKWEAYSTWISGMLLLTAVYYLGADAYLIDRRVLDLAPSAAIAIGVGFIALGWFAYHGLCGSALANRVPVLSALLLLLLASCCYALTHLFSGRGAYIHIGAMLGTLMVGNVFAVIMPSQRALVQAIETGGEVDPAWGAKAKLRSTHNTYLTLPVLFIMISNHYPMTYAHQYNWLVLLLVIGITAAIRQFFVLRHKGAIRPRWLVGPALATLLLGIWLMPADQRGASAEDALAAGAGTADALAVQQIIEQRCTSCHAQQNTDAQFVVAPAGVSLETADEIRQWAPRILARAVHTQDMPFMNKTGMTEEERAMVGTWIEAGMPE